MQTGFITGVSRGLWRLWPEAALERGDTVVLTARNPSALAPLQEHRGPRAVALAIDVADRAAVFATMEQAVVNVGRPEVVVDNADYGHFGLTATP